MSQHLERDINSNVIGLYIKKGFKISKFWLQPIYSNGFASTSRMISRFQHLAAYKWCKVFLMHMVD